MNKYSFLGLILGFTIISSTAFAAVDPEVSYILNTLLFLIGGFLVMWMAAGFAMLESGLVTSKSVATIAAKNHCKVSAQLQKMLQNCSKITANICIS